MRFVGDRGNTLKYCLMWRMIESLKYYRLLLGLCEIIELEVERALCGMKNCRVAGPFGITSDIKNYVGQTCIAEILKVFQNITKSITVARE